MHMYKQVDMANQLVQATHPTAKILNGNNELGGKLKVAKCYNENEMQTVAQHPL